LKTDLVCLIENHEKELLVHTFEGVNQFIYIQLLLYLVFIIILRNVFRMEAL